jgi:hypothetical protein
MNSKNKEVLRKIIYAVETGGQVYGQARYDDFTEAYTNSPNEHAITIGAGQWYADEAKTLLSRISVAGGQGFTDELYDNMTGSWATRIIKKGTSLARTIQYVISTDIGKACQDAMLDEQMERYCKSAADLGVVDEAAQAMCANFYHQGGFGAMKRVISKTNRPYTLDNLYQATLSDTGNQVGAYRSRQKFVYQNIKDRFVGGSDMSVEQIRKSALDWMLNLARDDSHGYSQDNRWGPDYDCSSAVIQAWQQAGVPVKTKGATYTGNMRSVFLKCGFTDVTSQVNRSTAAGMLPSDVLLNEVHHTAMFVGDGLEVEASINEKGGAHGGQPGDQTGREILVRAYRNNYPWDCVLRYVGNGEPVPDIPTGKPYNFTVHTVRRGSKGSDVLLLQRLLRGMSFRDDDNVVLVRDGEFGEKTEQALRKFQEKNELEVDGICGPASWGKMIGN